MSRNLFAIESREHISGGLKVCKLDEAITDWLISDLVFNQFHVGNGGNFVKLHSNIVFVHPGQYVTYPEGLALLLLLFLWHTTLTAHSRCSICLTGILRPTSATRAHTSSKIWSSIGAA